MARITLLKEDRRRSRDGKTFAKTEIFQEKNEEMRINFKAWGWKSPALTYESDIVSNAADDDILPSSPLSKTITLKFLDTLWIKTPRVHNVHEEYVLEKALIER